VTGGSGLAGIDVSDDDDVDVGLVFLTVESSQWQLFLKTGSLQSLSQGPEKKEKTNPMVTVVFFEVISVF
jgi:hypothetical protein